MRSDNQKDVRYKHYKGGEYIVLGNGIMENNLEAMIIYRRSEGGGIWIRPVKEFHGLVTHCGQLIKRFTPINGE